MRARVTSGFTLVELLIATVVLAILVALAAPSMRTALVRQQVRSAGNDLVADLQTARTLAISRGQRVGVIANGGDWHAGWQLQQDASPTAAAYSAASGAPLRQHGALPADLRIGASRAGTLGLLVFSGDGSVFDTASNARASADSVFALCQPAPTQAQALRVLVHASGQVSSYRDATVSGADCP